MVHSLIKALGLLTTTVTAHTTRIQPMGPIPATLRELSSYHTRDYLEFILNPQHLSGSSTNTEFGLEEVGRG